MSRTLHHGRPAHALPVVLSLLLAAAANHRAAGEEPEYRANVRAMTDNAPTAGMLAAAAHDSKRNAMLVFGGVDRDSPDAAPALRRLDLDTRRWSLVSVGGASPDAVAAPTLVYDPKRDALYLHGGWPRGGEQPAGTLWRLHLSQEKPAWERMADAHDGPRARNGAVMVLDPQRDRLILHGGDGGPHPQYGYTPLADLWGYDLEAGKWQQLQPGGSVPRPRWNHCGALDARNERFYIFGGAGYVENEIVRDTEVFELDLRTLKWKRHAGSGSRPGPVEGATLTYDDEQHVLVLVGGMSLADGGPAGPSAVHIFDLSRHSWTETGTSQRLLRCGHTAIYDSAHKQHVIVGGQVPSEPGNFYAPGRMLRDALVVRVHGN